MSMPNTQIGIKPDFELRGRPDRIVMSERSHLFTKVFELIQETKAKIDLYRNVPITERVTSKGTLNQELIEEDLPEQVVESAAENSEEIKLLVLEIEMAVYLSLADSHNNREANLEAIAERFKSRDGFSSRLFYLTWKKALERLNKEADKIAAE